MIYSLSLFVLHFHSFLFLSTLIRIGVSGWKFLLVPAYPGCPGSKAVKRSLLLLLLFFFLPLLNIRRSVLWHCWLGDWKGIRPVKNWVVGCWRGYLFGARYRLTQVVPDKGPLNVCVCVCMFEYLPFTLCWGLCCVSIHYNLCVFFVHLMFQLLDYLFCCSLTFCRLLILHTHTEHAHRPCLFNRPSYMEFIIIIVIDIFKVA